MSEEELKEEISGLIESKEEGGYWDFKKEWPANKADLLLDIICLANNLEGRDAYLIFGIKDKTFDIVGVNERDKNRYRNQNDITNFLRDKKFTGGVRPVVKFKTIKITGKTIDVLIMEDSLNVPFMLQENFSHSSKAGTKIIYAGKIYTRVKDQNTASDRSADIDKQEMLWRKRFRMDKTPYDKIQFYLDSPNDWIEVSDYLSDKYYLSNNDGSKIELYKPLLFKYYYKNAPEYSIEFISTDDSNRREALNLSFADHRSTMEPVLVKVGDIVLHSSLYSMYDGGRATLICPKCQYIKIGDSTFYLPYVIKDSFEYKINKILISRPYQKYNGSCFVDWDIYTITFSCEKEKEDFEKYIQSKYDEKKYNESMSNTRDLYIADKNISSIIKDNLKFYNWQWKSSCILKKEYGEYRNKIEERNKIEVAD